MNEQLSKSQIEQHRHGNVRKILKWLLVIMAVLGLFALSAFLYARVDQLQKDKISLQNSKTTLEKSLKQTTAQINDLIMRNKNLMNSNNDLQKKIMDLQSPKQATLSLSVRGSRHFDWGTIISNSPWTIEIDLTVKNTSNISGYFNLTDLKAKDDNNQVLSPYNPHEADGRLGLGSQSIRAEETTNGTVSFIGSQNMNHVTLQYGSQTFSIDVPAN